MVWVGFYGWQERDALVDAAKEGSGIASLVDLWSALGMQRAKDMVNTRGNLLKGIAGLSFSYEHPTKLSMTKVVLSGSWGCWRRKTDRGPP